MFKVGNHVWSKHWEEGVVVAIDADSNLGDYVQVSFFKESVTRSFSIKGQYYAQPNDDFDIVVLAYTTTHGLTQPVQRPAVYTGVDYSAAFQLHESTHTIGCSHPHKRASYVMVMGKKEDFWVCTSCKKEVSQY